MSDAKAILWVDLETTGGDEVEDCIIEVGAVLTDFEYATIASYQAVCKPTQHAFDRMMAHPVVCPMHTNNGLINELSTSPYVKDIRLVDTQLVALVRENVPHGKVILAGSGVGHFDRRFIDVQLWDTATLLMCAPLDIGVVRRFFRHAGTTFKQDAQPVKNHRALSDILLHLDEARQIRKFITDTNHN